MSRDSTYNGVAGPLKVFALIIELLIAHILISILSIFSLYAIELVDSEIVCVLILLLLSYFYFLSGYVSTNRKARLYLYFPIAFAGIGFWIICYLLSPCATDYKRCAGAGAWFYYELFVVVKSPLHFMQSFTDPYDLNRDLITKLAVPAIVSLLQFAGGQTKLALSIK